MVTAVEAPFLYFQKPIKIVLFYTVKLPHLSLGLVPKILDTINVIFTMSKQRRGIDALMPKKSKSITHIQRVVSRPMVGINDAIGRYFFMNNREQSFSFCVGNDACKHPTIPFQQAKITYDTLPHIYGNKTQFYQILHNLDLNLPRRDGKEVLEVVKEDKRLKVIPAIVLTSSKADSDIVQSYGLHANYYIIKPLDATKFMNVIRQAENFWVDIVCLPPSRENI